METKMKLFSVIFLVLICGCSTVQHMDELLTLKRVADSQKQIEIYLQKQEQGFSRLYEDINTGKLKPGKLERAIISEYSDPVLIKKPEGQTDIKEILLYRHPTEYFSSDRIYLYIDNKGKLSYWEIKPAENPQISS